jgi:ABC-2 type transport system permease protein
MNKVGLVLRKELREIFQTRALIYGLCVLPLVLLFLSGFVLYKTSQAYVAAGSGSPADFQSLIEVGNLFRLYVLAQPLLIPAMIAAYSIVGEKDNRTLEPVLATPIETWQLLLAKSLSAIIPAVLATWLSGGIYALELVLLTPAGVLAKVVSSGWLVLLFVTAPVLTLTPVALTVMFSSRFNDPRAASQAASLLYVAVLLFFSTVGKSLVISSAFSLLSAAILAVVGIALLRVATAVFQREAILTRWK